METVWQLSMGYLVYDSYGALWMYEWKIKCCDHISIEAFGHLASPVQILLGQGVAGPWTIQWSVLPLYYQKLARLLKIRAVAIWAVI